MKPKKEELEVNTKYIPKLKPENKEQSRALENLESEVPYNFLIGPAGSGKTLFATVYAIKKLLDGTYKKIVITRPAVPVDEDHGFLPGNLVDKLHPWMLPIIDIFMEFFDSDTLEQMFKEGVIEIAPLAYMRGRNLGAIMIDENSDKRGFIVIADEIQNSTPEQMKMLLTRLGKNSKMVITGDLSQHDRDLEFNGLKDAYERLARHGKDNRFVTIDKFNKKGVIRSDAVRSILDLYPEDDS
jgi:phosphate starvation-inducible PhoH-like protein